MIRKITYNTSGGTDTDKNPRVETGAIQFGEDWIGYFIRGDDCFGLAAQIKLLEGYLSDAPLDIRLALSTLIDLKNDIIENTLEGNAAHPSP
jgi:hypothetical protein